MNILKRKELNEQYVMRLNEAKLVDLGYRGWQTNIDPDNNVIAQRRCNNGQQFMMFNMKESSGKKYPTVNVFIEYDDCYPEGYCVIRNFDLDNVDYADVSVLIKEVCEYAYLRGFEFIQGRIPHVELEVPIDKLFEDEGFSASYNSEKQEWYMYNYFRSSRY